MIEYLIKLADRLDSEGKSELAKEVDLVIALTASKKAPLKHLDEKVKKNLIGFTGKVKKNLEESIESLEELFRRLRYFDMGHLVKETGLDKAISEMKNTSECVDGASKKIYELSYGKKPGKNDVDQMLDDDSFSADDSLSFFESQLGELKEDSEETTEHVPNEFWDGLDEGE